MKSDIQILRLKKEDIELFKALITLFNNVFEEYHTLGSESKLKQLLTKPEFHAVAAIQDHTVIGGLTAYELQRYYSDKSELYIYDIAVKTKRQSQGIGKALMTYLKEYALKNDIETIFVEAHSEDEQAVNFYEAVIGKSEKVDHFNLEIIRN